MKHMSKFSRFVRILAMFLCVAMVAGMVGTNAATAADEGQSGKPTFNVSTPTQNVVQNYTNKGTETGFSPVFTVKATINKDVATPGWGVGDDYRVLFNWQEKAPNSEAWIDSPIMENDKQVGSFGDFDNVVTPSTSWSYSAGWYWNEQTSDFRISSANGLEAARKGTQFRCVVRLYEYQEVSRWNWQWVEVGNTISPTFRVNYVSQVNIYQGNALKTTINVPYNTKLQISSDVFGADSDVELFTDSKMRARDAYNMENAVVKGMNLYAKVTKKHAVEFVMNGYGEQVDKQMVSDGQKASKPADPTDANNEYQFDGWFESDMQTAFDFNKTITADTKVYAKWSKIIKTVAVTFSHQNRHRLQNTVYNNVVVGTTITPPADPSCRTHTFVGWSSKPDMSDDFDFANTQITETTTIYSKWGVKVSFVSNIPDVSIPQQTVVYNQKVVEPTVTSNDYKVLGWYTDENFRNKYNFDTEINDFSTNFTLHAKVEKIKKVTVTFDMNGHGDPIEAQTFVAGGKATKPANPSATGYDFNGWTLDGKAYDFNKSVDDNITLVANWSLKKFTVTLVAREDDETTVRHGFQDKKFTVYYGENIKESYMSEIPTNIKCKTGHANDHFFEGWFTTRTLAEEFDFSTPITADTKIYAGWSRVSEETLVTTGAKTSYKVGEELDLTNVKIVRKITRINGATVASLPSQEVKVTKDMVTNYQAATATVTANNQKRKVNISYNNKTFSYDITVGLNAGSVSVDEDSIEKTYGDEPFVIDAEGTGSISFESSDSSVAKIVDGKIVIVGKGTATITITAAATQSHSAASTTVALSVAPKEIEVQWNEDEDTFIYNGNVQKPGATVSEDDLVNGDKVTLTITTDKESKNVGSYVATATISNDNYTISNAKKDFTIDKKIVDVTWENTSFTFDEESHLPKAALVEGSIEDGDTCTVSVKRNSGEAVYVGKYTAYAELSNGNYVISEDTATCAFEITPAKFTATISVAVDKLLCGREVTLEKAVLVESDGQMMKAAKRPGISMQNIGDLVVVGEYSNKLLVTVSLLNTGKTLAELETSESLEFVVVGGKVYTLIVAVTNGDSNYTLTDVDFAITYDGKQIAASDITKASSLELVTSMYNDGLISEAEYVQQAERLEQLDGMYATAPITAAHIPGEAKEENRVEPKCLVDGSVDIVVRCTACEEVLSSENQTIEKIGHKWGEWIQDKDPSAKEAGHKYRKCENDPSHIDEASIDKLPAEVEKITIVIPDSAKKQYWVDEKLDVTGIEVVLSLTDGTEQKIPVTANMVTGFDSSKAADAQKLTVTYQGESANYNVAIRDVFYTVTGDLKWTRGKNMRLTVHRNFDDQLTFGKFVKLMIGGKVVDKSAFKAWSGSLELEIYNDYLDALDAGDYDLYIEFEDGSVEAKITVPERAQKEEKPEETTPEEVTPEENETKPEEKKNDTPESPKTADTAQTYVWTILLSIAVVLMLAVVVIRRRREDAE
ncbi:MAG: InlB B-repeat-containing protein [Lachnospiraceae bacterium]|nr:InlB B-repeat-containing protein [Lachnospiraceae bacterium]